LVWLELALCVAVIVYAGVRLTRYGDAIADKTRLGGTWIGVVLIALVTSLPEVVVTVAAVRLGALDMAVGSLFGSNLKRAVKPPRTPRAPRFSWGC
jgi:cation:H+ antiporter